MTIHKSQGSQADEVTVLLPQQDSRLLSRELLYTAVTRAKNRIRVIGAEPAVRAAIDRRAVRAPGWPNDCASDALKDPPSVQPLRESASDVAAGARSARRSQPLTQL